MKRLVSTILGLFCLCFVSFSQDYPCDFDNILCDEVAHEIGICPIVPATCNIGQSLCIPIQVTDFTYVAGLEFEINYDPTVLQLNMASPIENDLGCLPGGLSGAFNISNPGKVIIAYYNVVNFDGICCLDNSVLFEVCFDVIGEPGDISCVAIDFIETGFQLSPATDPTCNPSINTALTKKGLTTVECNQFAIVTSHCNTPLTENKGEIKFYTCGGVEPYSYEICVLDGSGNIVADGMDIDDFEMVCVGSLDVNTYRVKVTDANGVMNTKIVNISEGECLDIDLDITRELSCSGDNVPKDNGEITVSIIGAGSVNDYNFSWSNGEFGSATISDLPAGTYSVTVEDRTTGCQTVESITLEYIPLSLDYSVEVIPTCNGETNGKIKIWANGGYPEFNANGIPIYMYNETNTLMDTLCIDVSGGQQTISVEDSRINNCKLELVIDIPFNSDFEAGGPYIQSVLCHGDKFPSIEVTAVPATQGTFRLLDKFYNQIFGHPCITSSNSSNFIIIENIPADTFYVEITAEAPSDIMGCMDTVQLIVLEPDSLVLDTSHIDPSCTGDLGSITFAIEGGVGPFDWQLNNTTLPSSWYNDLGNETFEIINLNPNFYELAVTDDNGCTVNVTFNLPEVVEIVYDVLIVDELTCEPGDLGSMIVEFAEACPGCTTIWKDINDDIVSMGTGLTNASQGCYTVCVTDANQICTVDTTVCLVSPSLIEFDVTYTEPTCFGGNNGSIGLTITQGSMPIEFDWDGFPLANTLLAPIPAGTYCVTITDDTGCELTPCFDLGEPDELELMITQNLPTTCFGSSTGQITVEGTNGVNGSTDFIFIVYDDQGIEVTTQATTTGTATILNLPSGDYTVIITDSQCSSTLPGVPFTIEDAEIISIDLDATVVTLPDCFGDCNGQIIASAQGGAGGYSYQWLSTGTVSPSIGALCGDRWIMVEVTDQDGCTALDSIFMGEPDTLVSIINTSASSGISCNDPNSGIIAISTSGGTPDYTYSWENNISDTNTASNLGVGIYNITISDNNGCTATISEELDLPDPVMADIPIPIEPACWGDTTCIRVENVSGGTGQYNGFSITNGGPLFPMDTCVVVFAGDYEVTVFDSAGCPSETNFITIAQPDQVTVDLGDDFLEVALGDSTNILNAVVTSSFDYTLEWSPNDDVFCIDPLCESVNIYPSQATTYEVTVTDENNCSATDNIQVTIGEDRNVYIPNAFSPNGDGTSDEFNVFLGPGTTELEYFGIYDRWGNLLFEVEDIPANAASNTKWDGTFKDKELMPGVYVYLAKVRFIDDEVKRYRGSITLVK